MSHFVDSRDEKDESKRVIEQTFAQGEYDDKGMFKPAIILHSKSVHHRSPFRHLTFYTMKTPTSFMDDECTVEMETLKSSYADELYLTSNVAGHVELPIVFHDPLLAVANDDNKGGWLEAGHQQVMLSRLSPICISFELPDGYPEKAAPHVRIHFGSGWMPAEVITQLESLVTTMWEDYDRTDVFYAYIDDFNDRSKTGFGLRQLTVSAKLQAQLVAFDQQAEKQEFDQASHECSVCLYIHKGSSCHRMAKCGHVFCVECLQNCYSNAILTGNMTDVTCMAVNCGRENNTASMRREKKAHLITSSELLKIPMPRSAVERYVEIKRKERLEVDKTVAWCPRRWCQGAAKNRGYPKPSVLLEKTYEAYEAEDAARLLIQPAEVAATPQVEEEEDEAAKEIKVLADRLQICEDCNFAFCKLCNASWHGDHYDCHPRSQTIAGRAELSREEQATKAFILQNTTPCPSCETPVQKSEWCNHITCAQCNAHFCYLCGMEMSATEPYRHYAVKASKCYNKVWV